VVSLLLAVFSRNAVLDFTGNASEFGSLVGVCYVMFSQKKTN